MGSAKAFLGVGWAFPFSRSNSHLALAQYEEDVRQAILIILGTNRGERVMRPDFGAGLRTFVFEPVSTTTMALLETRVRESLVDWEPRIDVVTVKVTTDEVLPNRLLVDLQYRIRATNTLHNLVYPFYLQEGAAP